MANQDTEITLGTGKLLGMFFGLVVLCAIFFATGYSLGKNASPGTTTLTEASVPATVPAGSNAKPTATQATASKPDCVSRPEGCAPAPTDTAAAPVPEPASAPLVVTTPEQKSPPAAAPEVARPAALGSASYVVQVAAVSKQQDAESLVTALRKKQYQVFIASQTADSLFHVQIGPFNDPKEAEAIRSRLVADGYNPIVKR